MPLNFRPGRVAPNSMVVEARDGANPQAEPALEVLGDLRLNHQSTGRPRGFNATRPRLELYEDFGMGGLVQLNAVTDPSAGNTYNTAGFTALLTANRNFELLGTNAVSADVTRNAEGGLNLATHGGGTDFAYFAPHLNSEQSPWTTNTWGSDQETTWEVDFKSGSSIGNAVVYWMGLKLTGTATLATDNDQAYFSYTAANSGGRWEANYSVGGTDTTIDTGLLGGAAVATSTRYRLKIVIDSARIPYFYVQVGLTAPMNLVAVGAALTDATDFIPYIGVQEASAAAKTIVVYSTAISRNRA